jgi:hypothetical protein
MKELTAEEILQKDFYYLLWHDAEDSMRADIIAAMHTFADQQVQKAVRIALQEAAKKAKVEGIAFIGRSKNIRGYDYEIDKSSILSIESSIIEKAGR